MEQHIVCNQKPAGYLLPGKILSEPWYSRFYWQSDDLSLRIIPKHMCPNIYLIYFKNLVLLSVASVKSFVNLGSDAGGQSN
jgi:hypothetical protein